jgi:histidyl-tRNA synthetase
LVGLFGVEPVATVGFGMGDVVLADFLKTHKLVPNLLPETHIYMAVAGDNLVGAQKAAAQLRTNGVNVAVDLSGKSLDKQLKSANKKGVPFVIVVGDQEIASQQFKLKNMLTGAEETHGLDRIASLVEDSRKRDDI